LSVGSVDDKLKRIGHSLTAFGVNCFTWRGVAAELTAHPATIYHKQVTVDVIAGW